MYEFKDTTSKNLENAHLPSEAMKFNGKFFENEIVGYRTLSVSGRELLSAEIQSEDLVSVDGAKYYKKRYPARTIIVTYQLIAKDDTSFREAFNKLNQLLNVENVRIVFNDEPDKYFIGTKSASEDPQSGSNSVIGTIEIYCADPFKYSTVLKEFDAFENENGELQATVINDGSIPTEIDYEIKHNYDTGYIGIVSESGTMQFGAIEEVDGENYKQNEMLLRIEDFISSEDDVGGKDYLHPLYGTKGSLTTAQWFGKTFLRLGTAGEKVGNANGGLRTLTIPADSEGAYGAKNFYCYMHVLFYAGLMGQTGEMSITFLTEDNKVIAAYNWHKGDTTGNNAHIDFIVHNPNAQVNDMPNGRVIQQFEFTTSHLQSQNPYYWDWGHCDILKEGSSIRFFYYGKYYTYIVPEIENLVCTKIQVAIKQWGDRSGNQFMHQAGFDTINFQKMNVEKWKNVPNRYNAGDICKIDGNTSKFYVNGMNRQDDEVLGTQYFKADAGENTIKFYFSDFTEILPNIKLYIREKWL